MISALDLVRLVLLADSDITAAVEGVHLVEAPQKAPFPYLVLGHVSEGEWGRSLSEAVTQWETRVSVSVFATTGKAASDIAELVKNRFGDLLNHQVLDVSTPAGWLDTWLEFSGVFDTSPDRSVFRRVQDFRVRWSK